MRSLGLISQLICRARLVIRANNFVGNTVDYTTKFMNAAVFPLEILLEEGDWSQRVQALGDDFFSDLAGRGSAP